MKITEKKFQHFENLIKEELESLLNEKEQESFNSFFQKYLPDGLNFDPRELSYAEKMKFVRRAYKKTKEDAADTDEHQQALKQLFSKSLADRLIYALNDDSSFKDVDGNWLDDEKAELVFYVLMSNLFYKQPNPKEDADLILPDGMPGGVKEIPQIPSKAVKALNLARRKFAIDMITGRENYGGADDNFFFGRARALVTQKTGLNLDNFKKLFDDAWDIDLKQKGHLASREFMVNLMKLINDENNRIKIIEAQQYDIRWVPAEKKYVKRGFKGDPKTPGSEDNDGSNLNDDGGGSNFPSDSSEEDGTTLAPATTPTATNNQNDGDGTTLEPAKKKDAKKVATKTETEPEPTKTATVAKQKKEKAEKKVQSVVATKTLPTPQPAAGVKFKISDFAGHNTAKGKELHKLVYALQKRLKELGHYQGEDDGVFGSGTSAALRKGYFK